MSGAHSLVRNAVRTCPPSSGGSITLGRLAAYWSQLAWTGDQATKFIDLVALPLIAFTKRQCLDLPAIIHGLIPGVRRGHFVEGAYHAQLVGDLLLNELPERPQFTFNATSL